MSHSDDHLALCNRECFCPIFIPSKARFLSERGTASILVQDQVPFTFVVEPGETEQYEHLLDRLVQKWWGDGEKPSSPLYGQKLQDGGGEGGEEEEEEGERERERVEHEEESCGELGEVKPIHASCAPPIPALSAPSRSLDEIRRLFNVASLPMSDQGISFVRNYILKELAPSSSSPFSCGQNKEHWYWVIDDDVQRFNRATKRKNISISPRQMMAQVYTRINQFHSAECEVQSIPIFSLEYSYFAYTYDDASVALNSYNNIACLYRYDCIPPDVSYRFRIREDYDFTLQLILRGHTTVRFRNLSFDAPRMGELSGGMTDYYRTQKEAIRQQNEAFLQTWPAVAAARVKGRGETRREDIRVHWGLLHPRRCPNPAALLSDRHTAPRKRRPPPPSPPRPEMAPPAQSLRRRRSPPPPPGWRGYRLVRWRCLTPAEAEGLHLRLLPPEELRPGRSVAVVPPLFTQRPSVVEAVLLERSTGRRQVGGERGVEVVWSAVARGLPLLTVRRCYELPDIGLQAAAAGVDAFFAELAANEATRETVVNEEFDPQKVEEER